MDPQGYLTNLESQIKQLDSASPSKERPPPVFSLFDADDKTPTFLTEKGINMSNDSGASKARDAQEFGPGNPIIIQGGFPLLEIIDILPPKCFPIIGFPPPPNAIYSLSPVHKSRQEEAVDHKLGNEYVASDDPKGTCGENFYRFSACSTEEDTTALSSSDAVINTIKSLALVQNDKDASHEPLLFNQGNLLADSIDFNRESWVAATPGVSGMLCSARDQREDFIVRIYEPPVTALDIVISDLQTEIDSGTSLEYCSKCQKRHILPGPSLTLQDRDTCYSYLPEWFPAQGHKKVRRPWDAFTGMLNEMVTLQEISQGYNHKQNPDKKDWGLEFHDPHPKWKQVGRKSGWWKCRAGPRAPAVERNCYLCRKMVAEIELRASFSFENTSVAARLDEINDFMNKPMRTVAEKDKAIIEQRIRSDGWPQHLGISNNNLPPHILPSIQNLDALPQDRLKWASSSVTSVDCAFRF